MQCPQSLTSLQLMHKFLCMAQPGLQIAQATPAINTSVEGSQKGESRYGKHLYVLGGTQCRVQAWMSSSEDTDLQGMRTHQLSPAHEIV